MSADQSRGVVRYRTIVADPPWPIGSRKGSSWRMSGGWTRKRRLTKNPELPYSALSVDEIAELPVADLAETDAILWLWSTRRVFREGEAARVARAWGFEPFGELIWGLRNPGMGSAVANDHEPVLLARRGKAVLDSATPLGVQFWRQLYGHNGVAPHKIHSAKPEGFLDLVESVSSGPYLEMFARRARFGWDYWGDESLETVELVS